MHSLREHAVSARSLDRQLHAHPDRQRALRQVQTKALAQLTRGRALVDSLLLRYRRGGLGAHGPESADPTTSLEALRACERRTRDALNTEADRAARLLGAAATSTRPPGRCEILAAEERALRTLQSRSGGGGGSTAAEAAEAGRRIRQLRVALSSLRALEADLDFQAELLARQIESEASTGYSRSNFAYGSTPLPSWVAIFDSEPVRAVLAKSSLRREVRYAVLGSSVGWLCFYGACVHGLRSHGIELIPFLAATAARVAADAGVGGATFECADMLSVHLGGYAILLLASQCWDEELVRRLRAKLLDELDAGAVVIDYTPLLGEEPAAEPRAPAEAERAPPQRRCRARFELACTVDAPVSWDGEHTFWVWRVVDSF